MDPRPNRTEPAELRLSSAALRRLPWHRAAHLAVVDAVEPGWDTPDRWTAGIAKISKAQASAAAKANLSEGIYDSARTVTKVSRDGVQIRSTVYRVSSAWTTRTKRRDPESLYVRLDKRFLRAHPRSSALTKRVYHYLALEQWLYGACALTPAQIAVELAVEQTERQTPGERVYQAIRSLTRWGECARTPAGFYVLPRYQYAKPNPERLEPDRRRSAAARARRSNLPLGTSAPVTRNQRPCHPEPPNESELQVTSHYALARVGEEGKAGDEEEQGTIKTALPRATEAITAAVGYLPANLSDDLIESLRIHRLKHEDVPLTEQQLDSVDAALSGRLREIASLEAKPKPERFAAIRYAIKAATHADELYAELKRSRERPELAAVLDEDIFRAVEA